MINYRLEGSGPPLLMLHGWGVTFTIWKNLAPLLTPYFQLVMVELPGFGQSPMPDSSRTYFQACISELEQLRQQLGFDRWSVLSYSVGTRVGEAYVRRCPDSISRAVFLCPLYTGRTSISTLRLLVKLDHHMPDLGDWVLTGWRINLLIRILGFNGRSHPYVRVWQHEVTGQPRRSLKMVLREAPGYASRPLALGACQALCIWGSRDHIVKRPRRLRSCDTIIRASHSAPMQAAPLVAAAAVPFLLVETEPKTVEPAP